MTDTTDVQPTSDPVAPDHSTAEPTFATRAQWKELLFRHLDPRIAKEWRRAMARYPLTGHLETVFQQGDLERRTGMALIDVSPDGLTARHYCAIPSETVISIALQLEDDPIYLYGRVVHSTGTVGGFKIGIQLAFADD